MILVKIEKLLMLFLLMVMIASCTMTSTGGGGQASRPEITVLIDDTPVIHNATYAFGRQDINQARDITVVLENSGDAPLKLTGDPVIALTGSGFSVTKTITASSIGAKKRERFVIRFMPIAVLNYQCKIMISNNDADEKDFTFHLSGIGVDTESPVVTIDSSVDVNTSERVIPITLSFSEEIEGFDPDAAGFDPAVYFSLTNCMIEQFEKKTPLLYTAQLQAIDIGWVSVCFNGYAVTDLAGNYNNASEIVEFNYTHGVPGSSATPTPTPVQTPVSSPEPTGSPDASPEPTGSPDASPEPTGSPDASPEPTGSPDASPTPTVTPFVNPGPTGTPTALPTVVPNLTPSANLTVVVSTDVASPTNKGVISLSIAFSEEIRDFTIDDIRVENGTIENLENKSLLFITNTKEFKADLIPETEGAVTVSLDKDVVSTVDGKGNMASNVLELIYDITAPDVVISSDVTSPTNKQAIVLTIDFSEVVTGLTENDFVVENGSVSDLIARDETSYSAVLEPSDPGMVNISLAAGKVADAAGNSNTASNEWSVEFDNTVPDVLISSSAGAATNMSIIPLEITFSKDIEGFDVEDILVTNGRIENLKASSILFFTDDSKYSADLIPATQGRVSVVITENSVTDKAGTGNSASNEFEIVYDTTAPNVVISSSVDSSVTEPVIPVVISFDEQVAGFDIADFTLTNCTLSSPVSIGNNSFSAHATAINEGNVSVSIAGQILTDAAGNGNTASNELSVVYNRRPSVVISSSVSGTITDTLIPLTITFSEDVTGFTGDDFSIGNGSVGTFQAVNAREYTAEIRAAGAGTVTVDIPAHKAVDGGGAGNTASNLFSVICDAKPELGLKTWDMADYVYPKSILDITFEVENTGALDAAPRIVVSFDIAKDEAFTQNVDYCEDSEYSLIEGNGSITDTVSLDLSRYYIHNAGTYYLRLTIDAGNRIAESDESNNVIIKPFELTYPDLTPHDFIAPESADIGREVAFEITVENLTAADAGPFDVAIGMTQDQNLNLGDPYSYDVLLNTVTFEQGIKGMSTATVTAYATIPATYEPFGNSTVGEWYIGYDIDLSNDVPEMYGGSNRTELADGTLKVINISNNNPNVIAESITCVESAEPGSTIEITFAVSNNGTADTGAFSTGLYISDDSYIGETDTLAAVIEHDNIPVGSTEVKTVMLPIHNLPDTICVGIIADYNNTLAETSEIDNGTPHEQVKIINMINMVTNIKPHSLAVSDTVKKWGEDITITFDVENAGNLTVFEDFTVRVYTSSDETITPDDTLIGEQVFNGLDVGISTAHSVTYTLPVVHEDTTVYFGYTIDEEKNISGEDTADNITGSDLVASVAVIPDRRPDLRARSLYIAADDVDTVLPGDDVIVQYEIDNVGYGDFIGDYTMHLYLSEDDVLSTTDDIKLGERTFTGLALGVEEPGSFTVTIPDTVTMGDYTIGWLLDAGGVEELETTNNSSCQTPVYVRYADLAPRTLDFKADVEAGTTIGISYTIENISDFDIDTSVNTRVYFSYDEHIDPDSDRLLNSSYCSGLASKTVSEEVSFSMNVWDLSTGTYYIGYIIDSDDRVNESNENNNVHVLPINITFTPKPNLWFTSMSSPVPDTCLPGDSFTVDFSLTNNGYLDIVDSFVVVASVDGSDIGTIVIDDDMLVGDEIAKTINCTLPADIVGNQKHTVFLHADNGDKIDEWDEWDNSIHTQIDIDLNDLVFNSFTPNFTEHELKHNFAYEFTYDITNTGQYSTTECEVGIYACDTPEDTEPVLIDTFTLPGLGPNETGTGEVYVGIPYYLIANEYYYFRVVVDYNEQMQETREDNNMGHTKRFVIRLPGE